MKEFDYVALGHLHGAQYVSRPKIRYCGTLLKYSVSESTQTKSLTVVTLKEKGEKPEIACYPLHPKNKLGYITGNHLLRMMDDEDWQTKNYAYRFPVRINDGNSVRKL